MRVGCQLIAYIDPMSGTVLLQLLIAAVVGAGLFFWRTFLRLLLLLTGRKAKSHEEDESKQPTEE